MKIEFGVQEYFNELKLMDAQYGQEEELYPWIYMLLQMAESRKGNEHKRLSIRDVHNLKRYNWLDGSTRGEMLYRVREKLGAPDFIILDSKMNQFYGCVEIKTLNSTLKMQKPKENAVDLVLEGEKIGYQVKINRGLEAEKYKIEYRENKKNVIAKGIKKCEKEIQSELEQVLEQVLEQKKFDQIQLKITNSIRGNVYIFCAEIENIPKEIQLDKYRLEREKQTKSNYGIEKGKIKMSTEVKTWKKEFGWTEEAQIISHLEKFKKVLYTNGLKFYFLNLTENEEEKKEIEVKELADLSSDYKNYKNHKPNDEWKEKASAEWDRLIAGLTSIDWHKDPVAKIPRTQPNTQE